ncbi:MAG: hypothetical protein GX442_25660 [Candidatus Riflebacteria bacterium]|nr:hypothetical protein [Candidatus Riflebacteria bacterium]
MSLHPVLRPPRRRKVFPFAATDGGANRPLRAGHGGFPGSRLRGRGVSLIEVVVGIGLAAICTIPILWLMTTTRTDTAKAVNYLRAVELAQEGMEWAAIGDVSTPTGRAQICGLSGSLVEAAGSGWRPVPVPATPAGGAGPLVYSAQYNQAFFFRTITVEDPPDGLPQSPYLALVTVTVWWNEGRVPPVLESLGGRPDRDRMVVLTRLQPKREVAY